ncbi:MAG: glycosyltransferase involved in cell wall biosynthesis [Flavobacteriaceae bacterium]|jgi:glycosyltransferase involved in cell wall biosynthesis
MAKRARIGLIFSYDEDWIAGAYYILNIIHALKTVEDGKQPHIVILSEKEENYKVVVSETNYPHLSFFKFGTWKPFTLKERIINKLGRVLLKRKMIEQKIEQPKINFLYPHQVESVQVEGLAKVNWIPDFQEEFLPHFFSKEEVGHRKKYQNDIVCKGDIVVFSSKNAQTHYNKLYPLSKAKQFVLPFAVTHLDYSKQKIDLLLEKYDLPTKYFFAPNQFWAHKNHRLILEAVKKLKDEEQEVTVAFSGKENDYRNLEYVGELKNYVMNNDLEKNIKFLGFIDRTEQLCIMKNAVAVVQSSLFEGWSTVVEDAKASGKYIVLSNLEIHKEQVSESVSFFNPKNATELSEILKSVFLEMPEVNRKPYKTNIQEFGNLFLELIETAK